MSTDPLKAVVVGGGLAGLSAGIKLLEEKPGAKVTLYTLGHHLGGKATSYRDADGFNIDHGFHALSTNYRRLLALLARSGVDKSKTLMLDRGTYYYDDRTGKIAKSGTVADLLRPETLKTLSFFSKNAGLIYTEPEIEQFDDICWTAWTVQHGLEEELTKKRSFRFSQDALFNWPHEVSAYITLKSLRLLGGSSQYYLVDGTYGEDIIEPIVQYFRKLGGRIELLHKLVEVLHAGNRVTGLRFALPDFLFHNHGRTKWERSVRVLPERTATIRDFDHVILAVPVDNFRELNRGDRAFWNGFPGVENLQTVATLSLQVWTEQCVLPGVSACINALDEPMPMVIDYKDLKAEYRKDDRFGSVLEWVGQETSFEHLPDEELKATAYDCFARIPGAKDPRRAGVVHESLSRNTSNHERYLLTDPGTLKFRPRSQTAWQNLFLAGDWIRNEVDVPTMEGAVCSGYTAVDELLKGRV
jgi:uncharacterized protein with NAD-binding domain and iron-sulfur cluster